MINYISIQDYCVGCRIHRRTGPDMNPRPGDFSYVYFKIGEVVYFEWNKAFEQALLVEKLTRDPT